MELIFTLAEAADEDALDLFYGFIKSSLLVCCYSLLLSCTKTELLAEFIVHTSHLFSTEQQQVV
jgi:hypothetical protein